MRQNLDKQLHEVFDKLNEVQKQQVFDFANSFLDEDLQYDKWKDSAFVAEVESRYNHYKSGGKMVSTEEVNRQVRELFKNAKNK